MNSKIANMKGQSIRMKDGEVTAMWCNDRERWVRQDRASSNFQGRSSAARTNGMWIDEFKSYAESKGFEFPHAKEDEWQKYFN